MPDAIAFPVRDILARARLYLPDMSAFLRDLIRIPSPSCHEEAVVRRIIAEMEKLGYTAEIDGMGNALGWLGSGSRLFAYDAHIDTVGPGTLANWSFDPYAGFEDEHCIGGLGASDQSGGMASMLYGGKIMADLGLRPESVSILMAGTVQEEDCDGLCWQYLIRDFLAARGMRPEAAVSTEPTDGGICRGHRGRMEIRVEIRGRSCHGSAPERGENAIFAMGRVLPELEQLAGQLGDDPFLGKGSLTVSEIFFSSPSRCAVADGCAVSIDRRLTAGEDAELALNQIWNLPAVRSLGDRAEVSLYRCDKASWTGLHYPADCFFPAWSIPAEHSLCRASLECWKELFPGETPRLDKWTFSTNATAIAGMFGIPVIGFGPGREAQAHSPDERTWKEDLVRCAAFYAALPAVWA